MTLLPSSWASRAPAWRWAFWAAAVAGVVLALWPESSPHEPWFAYSDKVQHALAFAVLAVLGRLAGYRRNIALAIGLLALGGAIEVAQSFTATRSAEWLDWLADAIGIGIGLCAWAAVQGRARGASAGLEQEHRG